jgi:tetratricopeptide (TPR) repeat protein
MTWNFSLLTPAEDRALQRLSLLAGPFDLTTATAVVADAATPTEAVPDLVWSLVDRSLLVADPAAGGTAYRALGIVRTFASARLVERDRPGECAARLARHYLRTLGPEQGTNRFWLDAFAAELDNVRSTLSFLTPADAEAAQALASGLARYHASVQSLRIGMTEVGELVDRWPQPTAARVGLLTGLGDLHARAGDVAAAVALAAEAQALRDRVGAPAWNEVGVEKLRGEIALATDRADEAADIAREALREPLGARGGARMWNLLGIAEASRGRIEQAAAAFEGELAAAIEVGDDVLLTHAHSNAAEIAIRQGRWAAAARHQRTCLEIAVSFGQPGMIAFGLQTSARIAVHSRIDSDVWPSAVRLVAKAEALLAETGLAQYSTDSRMIEGFVLEARAVLGADRYHREWLIGRELDPNVAFTAALEFLDIVVRGGRNSSGNPINQEV